MTSQQLKLIRISATKNSFLFIDATQLSPNEIIKKFGFSQIEDFVVHWTNGGSGVSADGMVFVSKPTLLEADYMWHFYNNDGSRAEMCGNASRAMWVFCTKYLNFKKESITFETLAGLVHVNQDHNSNIVVKMPQWKIVEKNLKLQKNNKMIELDWINTGVPHAVIKVDNAADSFSTVPFDLSAIKDDAMFFRKHPKWGPNGSNVTFYRVENSDHFIRAVTFERGVEDFTLSCGTGAVAAAVSYASQLRENEKSKYYNKESISIPVHVPGGELKIEIDFTNRAAKLIGNAVIDFELTGDKNEKS